MFGATSILTLNKTKALLIPEAFVVVAVPLVPKANNLPATGLFSLASINADPRLLTPKPNFPDESILNFSLPFTFIGKFVGTSKAPELSIVALVTPPVFISYLKVIR